MRLVSCTPSRCRWRSRVRRIATGRHQLETLRGKLENVWDGGSCWADGQQRQQQQQQRQQWPALSELLLRHHVVGSELAAVLPRSAGRRPGLCPPVVLAGATGNTRSQRGGPACNQSTVKRRDMTNCAVQTVNLYTRSRTQGEARSQTDPRNVISWVALGDPAYWKMGHFDWSCAFFKQFAVFIYVHFVGPLDAWDA